MTHLPKHVEKMDESILPEITVQRATIAVETELARDNKIKHPMCLYDEPINSIKYHNAVYNLALEIGTVHTELFDSIDHQRFQRRRMYGWKGEESAYDAYLICLWQPRVHFNYALFCSRHPDWEQHGKEK